MPCRCGRAGLRHRQSDLPATSDSRAGSPAAIARERVDRVCRRALVRAGTALGVAICNATRPAHRSCRSASAGGATPGKSGTHSNARRCRALHAARPDGHASNRAVFRPNRSRRPAARSPLRTPPGRSRQRAALSSPPGRRRSPPPPRAHSAYRDSVPPPVETPGPRAGRWAAQPRRPGAPQSPPPSRSPASPTLRAPAAPQPRCARKARHPPRPGPESPARRRWCSGLGSRDRSGRPRAVRGSTPGQTARRCPV